MSEKKFHRQAIHLPVRDLKATIAWYRDVLGFYDEWNWGEKDGGIRRDDMRLLFGEDPSYTSTINGNGKRLPLLWFTDNIESIYKEFTERGVEIADPLKLHPYGLREFAIIDINGYYIRVAEQTPSLHYARTTAEHPDFLLLVKDLDADLARRDGEDHAFYAVLNTTDTLKNVIVAYDDGRPVGCGAFRPFADDAVEIKRMYVIPEYRGRGIASGVLSALEAWASELGYLRSVLETGKRQPEAIALYLKRGYAIIPNFGKYANIDNSVCFEKRLVSQQHP